VPNERHALAGLACEYPESIGELIELAGQQQAWRGR
jgi:hypothetical protein